MEPGLQIKVIFPLIDFGFTGLFAPGWKHTSSLELHYLLFIYICAVPPIRMQVP